MPHKHKIRIKEGAKQTRERLLRDIENYGNKPDDMHLGEVYNRLVAHERALAKAILAGKRGSSCSKGRLESKAGGRTEGIPPRAEAGFE